MADFSSRHCMLDATLEKKVGHLRFDGEVWF